MAQTLQYVPAFPKGKSRAGVYFGLLQTSAPGVYFSSFPGTLSSDSADFARDTEGNTAWLDTQLREKRDRQNRTKPLRFAGAGLSALKRDRVVRFCYLGPRKASSPGGSTTLEWCSLEFCKTQTPRPMLSAGFLLIRNPPVSSVAIWSGRLRSDLEIIPEMIASLLILERQRQLLIFFLFLFLQSRPKSGFPRVSFVGSPLHPHQTLKRKFSGGPSLSN